LNFFISPFFYKFSEIRINVPSFSGKSFAAYATPQNALTKLNMDLVFKAQSNNDGIILYVGANDNGLEDFFSLAIKDRSLELRFDVGSGKPKHCFACERFEG
jgi:Laminin G domain